MSEPARIDTNTPSRIEVAFFVPLLPPSVNHYKAPDGRGGWYLSKEAAAFIDAVVIFSRRIPVTGPYFEVELTFRIVKNKFLKWDADNFEKVSFDALKHAGVISDDRYITRHVNQKTPVEDQNDSGTHYLVRGKGQP